MCPVNKPANLDVTLLHGWTKNSNYPSNKGWFVSLLGDVYFNDYFLNVRLKVNFPTRGR